MSPVPYAFLVRSSLSSLEELEVVQKSAAHPASAMNTGFQMRMSSPVLDLTGAGLGEAAVHALANRRDDLSALSEIRMGANDLGDRPGEILVHALACASAAEANGGLPRPQLQRLVLDRNALADRTARAVATLLSATASRLRCVNLAYNDISDAGAAAIALSLRENVVIEDMDLRHNRIGDAGVERLARALKDAITSARQARGVALEGPLPLSESASRLERLAVEGNPATDAVALGLIAECCAYNARQRATAGDQPTSTRGSWASRGGSDDDGGQEDSGDALVPSPRHTGPRPLPAAHHVRATSLSARPAGATGDALAAAVSENRLLREQVAALREEQSALSGAVAALRAELRAAARDREAAIATATVHLSVDRSVLVAELGTWDAAVAEANARAAADAADRDADKAAFRQALDDITVHMCAALDLAPEALRARNKENVLADDGRRRA